MQTEPLYQITLTNGYVRCESAWGLAVERLIELDRFVERFEIGGKDVTAQVRAFVFAGGSGNFPADLPGAVTPVQTPHGGWPGEVFDPSAFEGFN